MNLHNLECESVYAKGEDGEFHLVARRDECETKTMAEKEYIPREAAIEAFDDPTVERYYGDVCPESVIRVIEQIPAADVRPVVLCRDCKHNMANIPDIQDGININENWNACQLTELYDSVKPDDFCSRGVKREESADGLL